MESLYVGLDRESLFYGAPFPVLNSGKDRFGHHCFMNGVPPLKTITDFAEAIVKTTNLPEDRIPDWTKPPYVQEIPLVARASRVAITSERTREVPMVVDDEVLDTGKRKAASLSRISSSSNEAAMVTSEEEDEEEEDPPVETPRRGLGKSAPAPWSSAVGQEEPLFLPDPDESDGPARKRVLQDSPSRVEAVAKRSRKAVPSGSVEVQGVSAAGSGLAGPPATIDLGHLTVENDTPLTSQHVPGLGAIVSRILIMMGFRFPKCVDRCATIVARRRGRPVASRSFMRVEASSPFVVLRAGKSGKAVPSRTIRSGSKCSRKSSGRGV